MADRRLTGFEALIRLPAKTDADPSAGFHSLLPRKCG